MKLSPLIVALALTFTGCLRSNRGNTAPIFSEGPVQLPALSVTNRSLATRTPRNAGTEGIIQVGNILLITFTNLSLSPNNVSSDSEKTLPTPETSLPAFDQQVKNDGTITLIYNRDFQAAGKKTSDLENEIRDYYVPTCFANVTISIRISSETPVVYVDGDFKNPGRYSWTNGMTLKDAIEAAGGFTEFASRRGKVIHLDGRSEIFRLRGDWTRTNNPPVRPGDRIYNPRELL